MTTTPTPTVLIIGGTSGVGLAAARQLRATGAAVHVAGRGQDKLDPLTSSDPDLTGHHLDATDPAAVRARWPQAWPPSTA